MNLLPLRRRIEVARTAGAPTARWLDRLDALLLVIDADAAARLADLPFGELLAREYRRMKRGPGSTFSVTLPTRRGLRVVLGVQPPSPDGFQSLSLAGRMVKDLAAAQPEIVGVTALGTHAGGTMPQPLESLLAALYAASESRPQQKREPARAWAIEQILVAGPADAAAVASLEAGAHLARWLTQLPPNVLHPASYRRALTTLARRHGWRMHVYGEAALRRLGAGAFTAVARGSARRDAALVRLEYRPRRAVARGPAAPIALVGKGLCFDTGGHNLKSPKSMLDMHTDMAGSAVAVGILAALTEQQFPHRVDAWLALAENRIGPDSYTQQDIVTAADGTTIQVMHTDAEGRMVLADTLALASRTRPACIIDFATLTGACVTALTERMSGVFTNRASLRDVLEAAGSRSGERVWTLPMPADFDEDLDSPVADVVQCLIDGKGDHIYAARFLSRFVGTGIPWVHVDLSAAERAGGLAHVPTPVTGFGVRFGATLLGDPGFLRALAAPAARR